MKNKLFLLSVLLVFSLTISAQDKTEKKFNMGIGATAGFPTGDLASALNLGYVVDLMGEYKLDPKFILTLSAGYNNWFVKGGGDSNLDAIPILVGAKYFFSDKVYGSAQAGPSIFTASGAGTYFTFAPGIGYKVSDKFDLLLKYQSTSIEGVSLALVGIRAGLRF